MQLTRWTNPSLPQTLHIATFLLYIDAVLGLLLGSIVAAYFGLLIGIAYLVGCAAAGLGIANEQRWGWTLGVVVSIVGVAPYLLLLLGYGPSVATQGGFLLGLLVSGAQLALLLHPQSREHQRMWFS